MISVLVLAYASTIVSPLLQTIALLVSLGLLFYSSHPLGHYFVARIFGVRVDYFFLGRSDFRKLKITPARIIGNSLPKVGTKLDKSNFESLARRKRKYIFGSGVILSNILVGIQLAIAVIAGFSYPAILIGALFFVGDLGVELIFSTEVGDLSKMKKQIP